MKAYGDIEYVNRSTGERFQRVSGDGESRLQAVRRSTNPYMAPQDAVRFGPSDEPSVEDIIHHANQILKGMKMHYRNGREAKNGDKVVSLAGYGSGQVNINAIGILFDAVPGNDHCNGSIASTIGGPVVGACMCDCLHYDDVAALIVEKGWSYRPAGK